MFRRTARVTAQQAMVCQRFGPAPQPPRPGKLLGLRPEYPPEVWPVHALRHPPEGTSNGWYVWRGVPDIPQDDDDFFKASHPDCMGPGFDLLLPYLALPPGWRVLVAPGHEDVWYDENLLVI